MIFAGVFDRFPELALVVAEVDCGWVPVRQGADRQQLPAASTRRATSAITDLPSEYIERHFHFGYMTDTFGLRNRDDIGVERILWSSDYPHISADWPYSWRMIQAIAVGRAGRGEGTRSSPGTPLASTASPGSRLAVRDP